LNFADTIVPFGEEEDGEDLLEDEDQEEEEEDDEMEDLEMDDDMSGDVSSFLRKSSLALLMYRVMI
jgi:hypothetical protein